MAFNKGDLIAAVALNEINTSYFPTIRVGDHGYSEWGATYYFYSTRTSGELCTIRAQMGWNSKAWLTLYRWENGSWVQKDQKGGTSGWWNWTWDKGNINSFGEGKYRLDCDFGHFQYLDVDIHNSKPNCEKGRPLAMMNSMSLSQTDITFAREHETITVGALHAGLVYTL